MSSGISNSSMETFLQNAKTYMSYYDGKVKPDGFSESQEDAFQSWFHDDFHMYSFGHSSNMSLKEGKLRTKSDRRIDESKFMKLGCEYKNDSWEVLDENHLRWRATFIVQGKTIERDYLTTQKDGQIIFNEPYNPASSLKPLIRKYIAIFDGGTEKKKEEDDENYLKAEMDIIDNLFHDDLEMMMTTLLLPTAAGGGEGDDNNPEEPSSFTPPPPTIRSKQDLKDMVADLIRSGTKSSEVKLMVLDENHLQMTTRIKNLSKSSIDTTSDILITVGGGVAADDDDENNNNNKNKIIKIEPFHNMM